MNTSLCADVQAAMDEHVASLKGYARRVLTEDAPLDPQEDADRISRVREFTAIGHSLGCTERELVTLVYKGLFSTRRTCDCPTCQSRRPVAG